MKHVILIAAALAIPAPTLAEGFPEEDVKASCAAQFPGDFFMQSGCLNINRDGWEALQSPDPALPEDVAQGIVAGCRDTFPGDFFMQSGCLNLQTSSWKDLNR